jgi:Tol biopolymer transport system component
VAASTHWSPDGKRIVFLGTADLKTTAYLVSTDGGLPEPVPMPDDHAWVPRSWSPDGATLALGRSGDPAAPIQLLDLRTGHPLKVPGSEGLIVPLWSPDGRRLAALSGDRERLVLYDFASSRWHDLLTGKERLSFPTWSRDSLSLFLSEGEARIRVVAADGRRAAVATFDGLRRPVTTGGWVGRTPDDSVITLRDLGLQEIFALDWEAP